MRDAGKLPLLIGEFRFSISPQLAVFSGRQSYSQKIHYARFWLSSGTRIAGCSYVQRRETATRATRCISHNEPAGTYTLVYEHCNGAIRGAGRGTDRAVGVASVMLQVQCISLPKRFVPSVSKCPSVVCPALTSPFLSFSRSLPICTIYVPRSLVTVSLVRTHPRGKRRANTTPRLIARAHARDQCSRVN